MRFASRLAFLLAITAAALAATSASALAAGVTITPPGNFNANGAGTLTPDGLFLPDVVCTTFTASGSLTVTGEGGTASITFDSCSALGIGCTITPGTGSFTLTAGTATSGTITNVTDPTSDTVLLNCGTVITCSARFLTGDLKGTITSGSPAKLTVAGTVATDPAGGNCTGVVDATATVTAPNPRLITTP